MRHTQLPQTVAGRALNFIGAQALDPIEFESAEPFIAIITKAMTAYAGSQKEPGLERCAIFIEHGLFTKMMPDFLQFDLVEKDNNPQGSLAIAQDYAFTVKAADPEIFIYSNYMYMGAPIFVLPAGLKGRLELIVGDLWCFVQEWQAPAINAYRPRTAEEQTQFEVQEAADLAAAKIAKIEHDKAEKKAQAEKKKEAAKAADEDLAAKAENARAEA